MPIIDEKTMKELERTEHTLRRHLEDLNDQVEANNGRIKDHMVLDGFKDCLKGLKDKAKIVSMCNASKAATPETAAAK